MYTKEEIEKCLLDLRNDSPSTATAKLLEIIVRLLLDIREQISSNNLQLG